MKLHKLFDTLQGFELGNGKKGTFYSLPQLEKAGVGPVSRLPAHEGLDAAAMDEVLAGKDGRRPGRGRAGEFVEGEDGTTSHPTAKPESAALALRWPFPKLPHPLPARMSHNPALSLKSARPDSTVP